MKNVQQNCNENRINLLVCDVDGVLTDGGMYYDENGNEWKKFNTKDGKGIELLRLTGVKVMFLTSENTSIVQRRADKLNIDFCFMGIKNKKEKLNEFFKKKPEFSFKQTAYIGDDVNDIEVLNLVAFSAVPNDAVKDNLLIAKYICEKSGGQGCVREVCDFLIKCHKNHIISYRL